MSIKGKRALVTGASAGIGGACAEALAAEGCNLVVVARRAERLEELKARLEREHGVHVHTVTLDVSDTAAIAALPEALPAVDILVNNAGFAVGVDKAHESKMGTVEAMFKVNVLGLVAFHTAFVPGMVARGYGHVINIGSIAGHEAYAGGSAYCATKHAVDAFTTSARHDLLDTPVRVTAISPGAVNTEFSTVRFGGDKAKADGVYAGFTPLVAEDIADNVCYAATRPLHVQVADIVVLANAQSGAKAVHRGGV